ncbi:MAG: DUF5518 domain-containing protein [Methanobrevibacter sp.]|uniref:DUF5518 domain-containing protein n=1 Tax=Methanobrevibacter sp. TaxID=66852 RepID=UPI0026DEC6E7|nr:DUF5518 domain-containing protein [Methanobrevibacter sp.]MDO5848965.1 DUF5518 domain-containing protein [Methanobrevibacter sp.]
MAKWGTVFIGFILAVIVKTFFGLYELPGLLLVGFIVGLIAHEGALGGLWNAALAGAFGNIVCSIIFIIIATLGGGALMGIFGGLVGFTVSGVYSLIDVIGNIIYYVIVMGIAGAVGGAISSKRS